jgi:hypothetical protein
MQDNQDYIGGAVARFCKECGTRLYDNIPLEMNGSLEYICPKCTALWRVSSFIFSCMIIFVPLPEISWMWIVKVAALAYAAISLQSFIVCLPYFLRLKK